MFSCILFLISGICLMWIVGLVIKYRSKIPDIIVMAIFIESILLFLISARPLLISN
jgi:hypothetical protein